MTEGPGNGVFRHKATKLLLVPKVAIFIDGSNLYHGGKRANLRVDVQKLARKLVGDRELVRTYYYAAPVPQEMNPAVHESQARFLASFDYADYFEVKLGRIEPRPGGRWEEKGVDAQLATDMVFFAARNLYEVAILVSGDGDFVHTVQAVKDLGKHVENAYYREGHSRELQRKCDKFIELTDDYLKNCLRPKREAAAATPVPPEPPAEVEGTAPQ